MGQHPEAANIAGKPHGRGQGEPHQGAGITQPMAPLVDGQLAEQDRPFDLGGAERQGAGDGARCPVANDAGAGGAALLVALGTAAESLLGLTPLQNSRGGKERLKFNEQRTAPDQHARAASCTCNKEAIHRGQAALGQLQRGTRLVHRLVIWCDTGSASHRDQCRRTCLGSPAPSAETCHRSRPNSRWSHNLRDLGLWRRWKACRT